MFKMLEILRILKYISSMNFYVSRNVHLITVYRDVNEDTKIFTKVTATCKKNRELG